MNARLESDSFPYLPLRLEVRNRTYAVEALIDTGFDGDLAVPPSLLGASDPVEYTRWTLADGSCMRRILSERSSWAISDQRKW